jgi:hypothetical protein
LLLFEACDVIVIILSIFYSNTKELPSLKMGPFKMKKKRLSCLKIFITQEMTIGLLQVVMHLNLRRVSMGMRMTRGMKIMRVMKGAMNVRRSHLLVPKESSMILLLERTRGRNRRLSEDIGCEINYPNLSP